MERQYKEYDPEELKKLQKVQTEILADFITICKKYNLSYYMEGGSGIGAVRHHGFIPWDDDIDVTMPRKDYDVFLAVLDDEMGDKYKILNPLTDKNYTCNVTKLQKKGTKFVPYIGRNLKCDFCIDIDIFPLDKVAPDKKLRSRQLKKTWVLNKLIFLCGIGDPVVPLKGIAKVAATAVIKMIHLFLKVFHVSPVFLYKMLEKEETRYNDSDSHYYNAFRSIYAPKQVISDKDLFPLCEMKFENLMVNMPNNYDKFLTNLFGDYMTMPPEDKRINHCPYLLDFGEEQ